MQHVIMQCGNINSSSLQLRHDGRDFVLDQNQIAHHHRTVATR